MPGSNLLTVVFSPSFHQIIDDFIKIIYEFNLIITVIANKHLYLFNGLISPSFLLIAAPVPFDNICLTIASHFVGYYFTIRSIKL